MSLRSKIVLILCAVVAGYALVDHALQRMTIGPSFEQLESEQAVRHLERVRLAVEQEVAYLDRRCRAWAARAEIGRMARGGPSEPGDGALPELALGSEALDLFFVCGADGAVRRGEIREPDSRQPIALRDFPAEALSPAHTLFLLEPSAGEPRGGLLATERGALLVCAAPVPTGPSGPSEPGGGSPGWLLLGRFLGADLLAELAHRTAVDFRVWPVDAADLPGAEAEILDRATAAAEPLTVPVDEETLSVYGTLADLRAAPVLLVRADLPRAISARGRTAVRYALLSTVAAGLLLVVVLLRILQRAVVAPLARLTAHAVELGKSPDPRTKLGLERSDEIGVLSTEFDRMIERLAESRAALVTAARSAGMSEIATGILHNVGNVLNSVQVSTGVMSAALERSRVVHLERLAEVVGAHEHELGTWVERDPQGRKLAPFLGTLARQLVDERGELEAEIRALAGGVEHIGRLVASQQAFARRSTLRESTSLAAELDAAVALTAQAEGDVAAEIAVERDYQDVGPILMDRHKLLEILVNLIQNARHALAQPGTSAPRLTLRIRRAAPGSVRISVADNGVGIPRENMERIFQHGFTTKPGGHGFGLHSAANAARELNGSLVAASDGPGRGATFTLEIPTAIAVAA